MLAGSESDLQRMMDRLNMVSVNYNIKINRPTEKTKVWRVGLSKGSKSDNEDSSCRGNYRTSQGILLYLGSMISDDATEKSREGEQQRRQSGLKSGGRGSGSKKFRFLQANFRKNSITFFRQFYKRISSFAGKFRKILIFCCCCCSKVLRRHMAHRPSTSFMSVLYNLSKWLFLYSVYFSSLFFSFFFSHFLIFFLWPTGSFFSLTYMFFLLCSSFFPSVHTQLFTIELFTMVLITCELIYIPIC